VKKLGLSAIFLGLLVFSILKLANSQLRSGFCSNEEVDVATMA
jgi:hypothetical protein